MTDDVYKKQIGGDHYSMPIQPAEFINKNNIPFAEGNAIKYLCRHSKRGKKRDLQGQKKYKKTMCKNNKDIKLWIEDAQEEALDLVMYLEKVKQKL